MCERLRSDDHLQKIADELRPGASSSRKAAVPLDAKLSSSLDVLFGVSAGIPAPITDIVAVFKGDPIPDGFTKVRRRKWACGCAMGPPLSPCSS